MKRTPLLLVFFATRSSGVAQSTFQKSYGGVLNEQGHGIIPTYDGGYAVVGPTNSFGAGGDDIFILKIDSEGTILWQKTYGGSLDEYGNSESIVEAPNHDLIVTGVTNGSGNAVADLYIFRTDENGNLLWENSYDSGPLVNSGDFGRGLIYSNNDDIIVVGTDDADSFGSNDGLAIRIDSDGNLIWKFVYGDFSNDHFLDGIELPAGNLIFLGSSQSFGPGNTAGYIVKTTVQGDLLWANTYGGNGIDYYHSCDATANFDVIAAGATTSFGAGGYDVLLSKIDSAGNLLWSKTYGGSDDEWGVSVQVLPEDAGYTLVAFTESFGNGSRDILFIRTDEAGDVVVAKTFGTQGFENVDIWANKSLAVTPEDGFIFTGWSDSLSVGGEDILVVKGGLDGSILCSDTDIIVNSPTLTRSSTETHVASPGVYGPSKSSVAGSAMISQQLCYCQDNCEKCEQAIVHYDLNACYSFMGNGSDMDYSEFSPSYPNSLSYAEISASAVHRGNFSSNKHSCTPGVENSPAMCVGSMAGCDYVAGSDLSVVFEISIIPDPDSAVQLTALSFYEKSPANFEWIGGASGPNNYPTLFAVRVMKNGVEIFLQKDIPSSLDVWEKKLFGFAEDSIFTVSDSTTFTFELLGYCQIDNGASVAAWDLDELEVLVSCDANTGFSQRITGFVRSQEGIGMANVQLILANDENFDSPILSILSSEDGHYAFEQVRHTEPIYLQPYNNEDFLNGVTTLDLIAIQKHILGLARFTSPYQLIAADANKSNSVSTLDLALLRMLILRKIVELPDNTSWRFTLSGDSLPLMIPWIFSEYLEIPNNSIDIGHGHFTAIKTGDVNNDAEIGIRDGTVISRNFRAVSLSCDDQKLQPGKVIKIDFFFRNPENFIGVQFSLEFKDAIFSSLESGLIELSDENYHIDDFGTIYLSWNAINPLLTQSNEVLFSLYLEPMTNGNLLDLLTLNSKMSAEMYIAGDPVPVPISLDIQQQNVLPGSYLFGMPNPFQDITTFHFNLETASEVNFNFYSTSGNLIKSYRKLYGSGDNSFSISNADLNFHQGIIICQLATKTENRICKMSAF